MNIVNRVGSESTIIGQVNKIDKRIIKKELISWVKFIILLAATVFVVKNSFGITVINGNSMQPSLQDGSLVLVNKFAAVYTEPSYGDVVVLEEHGFDVIKRVIGLPGDTVSISGGVVFVNDSPLPELHTIGEANDMSKVTVGAGRIFVMGDNRIPGESLDSRDLSVGPIPIDHVKGYATISLFPFYKIMKPLLL